MSETRDAAGQPAAAAEGQVTAHGLKRNLHVWEAIGLSVGAMSPALAMSFSGPGVAALVGRGAALSFVFAGVTCCLIGYGYMLLTRKYNHAGSVYGFVGASLGPRTGVFSSWAMSPDVLRVRARLGRGIRLLPGRGAAGHRLVEERRLDLAGAADHG